MFELTVNTELRALHSLNEREQIHNHIWRIEVCVSSTILHEGRVLSLPILKKMVDQLLKPLQNQKLNGHSALDVESAKDPTCENISRFLFDGMNLELSHLGEFRTRSMRLNWVRVAVAETDGVELGGVRYSASP